MLTATPDLDLTTHVYFLLVCGTDMVPPFVSHPDLLPSPHPSWNQPPPHQYCEPKGMGSALNIKVIKNKNTTSVAFSRFV